MVSLRLTGCLENPMINLSMNYVVLVILWRLTFLELLENTLVIKTQKYYSKEQNTLNNMLNEGINIGNFEDRQGERASGV